MILIFIPILPRTKKNLEFYNLFQKLNKENVFLIEHIGYLEFINLMQNSNCIINDLGEIQEEASYLEIPFLTLRESTERPIKVAKGTNTMVGNKIEKIRKNVDEILSSNYKKRQDIDK